MCTGSINKRYIIYLIVNLIIFSVCCLLVVCQNKKETEFMYKSEFYKLMKEEKLNSYDWFVSAESELRYLDSLLEYYKKLDINQPIDEVKFSTFCFFLGEQKGWLEREYKEMKEKIYSENINGFDEIDNEDEMSLFEQKNHEKILKLKEKGHIYSRKRIDYTRVYEKWLNNEEKYKKFCIDAGITFDNLAISE